MKKVNRYPGVKNFVTSQANIFCGRDRDIKRLYTKIMLHDNMVLHAESGVGKSSIVQAGIIPELKSKNPEYLPITIRFGNKIGLNDATIKEDKQFLVTEALHQAKDQVKEFDQTLSSFNILKQEENDFWYFAKQLQPNKKQVLFVFDQFEEFSAFTPDQITSFKECLSKLFSYNTPAHIEEQIDAYYDQNEDPGEKTEKEFEWAEERIYPKVVFVIREDKLGLMSQFTDYFPNILKQEFKLDPLNRSGAKQAIEIPASIESTKESQSFISPSFEFEKDALDKILNELDRGKKRSVRSDTDPNSM